MAAQLNHYWEFKEPCLLLPVVFTKSFRVPTVSSPKYQLFQCSQSVSRVDCLSDKERYELIEESRPQQRTNSPHHPHHTEQPSILGSSSIPLQKVALQCAVTPASRRTIHVARLGSHPRPVTSRTTARKLGRQPWLVCMALALPLHVGEFSAVKSDVVRHERVRLAENDEHRFGDETWGGDGGENAGRAHASEVRFKAQSRQPYKDVWPH